MRGLLAISRAIDALNSKFGAVANYFVLFAALLSAANAAFRYGLNGLIYLSREYQILSGIQTLVRWYGDHSNSFLEAQWYMFAAMVLLGAPFTLKMNEHVRVDLVYGTVSERTRIWIDIICGFLFLLPICIILTYFTWPWFVESWTISEESSNAGGLIRWPVKLLLPAGFFLMILQGASEIIKRIAALEHVIDIEFKYEKPLQ